MITAADELFYLNRIEDVNSNKGIKFLHRAASPGSHCPLHTALATVKRMGGISSLVVGMPECGYYSRFVMGSPYGRNQELHYTYEMDSNEVVFGCREGLMEALRQMDGEGAEIIMIIATCIPELIGEDIEAVVKELQGDVTAKLLSINVAHFKRNGYQAGFFNTLARLLDLAPETKNIKKAPVINILGSCATGEMGLINGDLVDRGFIMNLLDMNLSLDKIQDALYAKISIVMTPGMMKFARALNERYGIPYLCLHNIYSGEDITKAYKMIMNRFGLKFDDRLRELQESLHLLEEKCKMVFGSKKFIASNPELDVIPVTAYLSSLGMIPVLLHVEEFYEENAEFCSSITGCGVNPYVCYISDRSRLVEVVCEEDISLSLGNCEGMEQNKIISDFELNRMLETGGYYRSVMLLEAIIDRLESTGKGK